MRNIHKGTLAGLVLGGTLLLVGCQSNGNANHSEAMAGGPSTQAVTCEKCKVTWVKVPKTNQKGHVISYTQRKSMECPDCRSAVENFFATGKLEHSCKTCGSNLEICEAH